MRVTVVIGIAIVAFGFARSARTIVKSERAKSVVAPPYAPSKGSAPFISLGYKEAAADLMFVRLRGYFGGEGFTPDGIASICESLVALDPRLHRTYAYCAGAMTYLMLTSRKDLVEQDHLLRTIALLERGIQEFPDDWRIPNLAGQIYTQDLETNDPAQRRAWDEKGTLLVESAIRKPGAPAELQDWAAVMRTKYGQQERAMRDLRELLLVTTDTKARRVLIERLATLANENADEIAGEIHEERRIFEKRWRAERPSIPPTWYVLLGPRPALTFNPADLATGGRDLATAKTIEALEPVQ